MANWLVDEPFINEPVAQGRSWPASLRDAAKTALDQQQGHLFHWSPICLAIGIGIYFALRFEPSTSILWLLASIVAVTAVLGMRSVGVYSVLALACALTLAGFSMAGLRTHIVSAPVLDFRYYGPVQGRIIGLDRSGSGAERLLLDQVVLSRMAPADIPERVRVSLLGERTIDAPFSPGDTVMLTGHLMAPNGPAEPGGFDFRRFAWFQKIGAFGYSRAPVVRLATAADSKAGFTIYLARIRKTLSDKAYGALDASVGGFAAVIISGDRSHLAPDTLSHLRAANLAHLLAISGLHMGLLSGFVFGALRLGLVALPVVRHFWPIKQIAAIGAMLAATSYLLISGASVATERAWVMAMVALLAVLVNRRALSLRAVALAALIVLVLRPEALLSPGFQMSFAATTALVVVFDRIRDVQILTHLPSWSRPFVSLLISSFVAGVATAPVAMAHFNMIAHYGYIANLVALPVMGVLVMPMAVISVLAMPFGLEAWPLAIMGLGLQWILIVAGEVSSWQGSVGHIPSPNALCLPLMSLGVLFWMLWQGSFRWAGCVLVASGAFIWFQAERPNVLISQDGGQIGIMTVEGRALSKARGAGFVSGIWLENDGAPNEQEAAALLWPGTRADGVATVHLAGRKIVHVQGKKAAASITSCASTDILVSNVALPDINGCLVLTPDELKETGAIALSAHTGMLNAVTASDITGRRPWSSDKVHGIDLRFFR